jgi:hypothetical protein
MTGEARVVALDRLRPGDIADCSGELLDVVFGWADFARLILRRAASGLWLAATLADELSITSGPDSTIVSLYMRLE